MEFDPSTIETKPNPKAPLILVYGGSGVGKTSFLESIPNILIADFEGKLHGSDSMRLRPKSYLEFRAWLVWCLKQENPSFEALGIDSLDWLESLIWKYICEEYNAKSIEDDYVKAVNYMKGYVLAANILKNEIIPMFEMIRDKHNIPIISVCHAAIVTRKLPDIDPYDIYDLKLHKKFKAIISERVEAKIYAKLLFTENKEGKPVPTDKRVFITTPQKGIEAKNNLFLPPSFPVSYNNGWDDFINVINTNKPKKP